MSSKLTEGQFLDVLRRFVQKEGTQKAAAHTLDVSPSFLNDVLKQRRDVTGRLAQLLGYRRTVVFEKGVASDDAR